MAPLCFEYNDDRDRFTSVLSGSMYNKYLFRICIYFPSFILILIYIFIYNIRFIYQQDLVVLGLIVFFYCIKYGRHGVGI